ncbi:hypothetical protein IT072_19675 [Leifsonia sp. ZF2019]|uniref:hypothetical protein n=1 Tax=Leifsonia sp. ZF2019 TaxID=2781978 RepID=UPI001CBF74F4|nr:hypothetical protein [Leifsonia sp. ZF2019]UAJ79378.1 hypothetical protein IT072_19675 [Leifsonia sp. ZF2019]
MQKTKHNGRRRAIIAGGALLGVAALTTAAGYIDNAFLNLGGAGDGNGSFGTSSPLNIQVVETNADYTPKFETFAGAKAAGAWQEADDPAGVSFAIRGSDTLIPGHTDWKSVNIPFINDEDSSTGNLDVSLADRGGDTALRDALRFTVSLDGAPLPGLTNVAYSAVANASLGEIAPGEGGVLTIGVNLPDQGSDAANNALAGLTSKIQAVVHAAN